MEFRLLIVNFHYFREERYASGIYPVSSRSFLKQIDVLSKSFAFCSQGQIIEWLDSDCFPRGNYCLITFDDGLAEQMEAFHLMRAKGIPGLFFVPAGPFLSQSTLTVHKLHYVRSVMNDESLFQRLQRNPVFRSSYFDQSLLGLQYRYDSELARKIKYFFNFILTHKESDQLIDELFSDCVSDKLTFTKNLYMSIEDLVTLGNYDTLASHGSDHHPLAVLPEDEWRRDISDSLLFFMKCTGSAVRSFSYPYGSKAAVSMDVAESLGGTSVRFAATMFRGINTERDLRARYLLKRVDTNDAPGGRSPLKEFV